MVSKISSKLGSFSRNLLKIKVISKEKTSNDKKVKGASKAIIIIKGASKAIII